MSNDLPRPARICNMLYRTHTILHTVPQSNAIPEGGAVAYYNVELGRTSDDHPQ